MRDPQELYRFENDAHTGDLGASVLVVSLGGLVDAGHAQRTMTDHLLTTLDHQVIASFDIDELLDYRGRRPALTFDADHFSDYDDPALVLHRVTDTEGTPFLLLAGEKDVRAGAVSFRFRDGSQANGVPVPDAVGTIRAWAASRRNDSPTAETFDVEGR